MMTSEINEQYLQRLLDDIRKEQTNLFSDSRTETNIEKCKDITKQVSITSQLLSILMRYKNLKRTIQLKINST